MKSFRYAVLSLKVVSAIIIFYLVLSITTVYFVFKKPQLLFGLTQICQSDKQLGWALKPACHFEYNLPCAPSAKVQVCTNLANFRTKHTAQTIAADTAGFLFLGCSFTFGMNCNADSTYAQMVADYFGKPCLNAAIPGAGFAALLQQARIQIPKHKPEVVFFQNSDWMMERSTTIYAPTIPWYLAVPYFNTQGKTTQVISPLYENNVFFLNQLNVYKTTGFSPINYLRFFYKATPLFLTENYHRFIIFFFKKNKPAFAPTLHTATAYYYLFNELQQLCAQHHAQLIIVGLGQQLMPAFTHTNEPLYVDAEAHLKEQLLGANYERAYNFWEPGANKPFDDHPNPTAQHLIADAIIQAIKTAPTSPLP